MITVFHLGSITNQNFVTAFMFILCAAYPRDYLSGAIALSSIKDELEAW
jgi:hypothetical protein